jgi:hypothetical protein
MLFFRALIAKGDIKSLSNDSDRAINAMELAVICNFTASLSPSTLFKVSSNKSFGTLSKTPSVATE